ncbi:MAG: phosphatidate cytidylyltransferase [Bryobacteraceae bacterium]|nr:phosphatidate cytidylyltransferase [Bryobacteraceae bacterium]
MKRLTTGLILTPTFFWLVTFAPSAVFLCALALVAVFCLYEFLGIAAATFPSCPNVQRFVPVYIAGLLFLLLPMHLWLLAVLFALAVMVYLTWRGPMQAVLPLSAALVLGLLYTFGSWRAAVELRAASPWWLLFAVAVNWVGDTFAFYGGKLFGQHKMAPEVSPNKTWEGAACSVVMSTALGLGLFAWKFPAIPLWKAGLLCMAANLSGQVGDLAESAMKRGAGVKDSGSILPGHGGWLDRVDSSLFSVPVVYWILQAWGIIR